MSKYIDADLLREKLIERLGLFEELTSDTISPIRIDECKKIIGMLDRFGKCQWTKGQHCKLTDKE